LCSVSRLSPVTLILSSDSAAEIFSSTQSKMAQHLKLHVFMTMHNWL
jgi:hypothetical protein